MALFRGLVESNPVKPSFRQDSAQDIYFEGLPTGSTVDDSVEILTHLTVVENRFTRLCTYELFTRMELPRESNDVVYVRMALERHETSSNRIYY